MKTDLRISGKAYRQKKDLKIPLSACHHRGAKAKAEDLSARAAISICWMPDPRANVELPEVWLSLRGFERDGV
jgi:hypothetical protein